MSTIGANAQLQPMAWHSAPATSPMSRAIEASGWEPACRWVQTKVPSLLLPKPPISGLDAISNGTFDFDWA